MTRRVAIAAAAALASCGYRVGTGRDLLPSELKTIAIPEFGNLTNRYRLSERIPGAIAREFISRTRYRIVPEMNEADAILRGGITNYMSFPAVSDPASGRATGVQISVLMQLSLTERKTGKIIYNRPLLEMRQRYEIAVDQSTYFEESDVALDRLSRDVARTVVSAVLEAF